MCLALRKGAPDLPWATVWYRSGKACACHTKPIVVQVGVDQVPVLSESQMLPWHMITHYTYDAWQVLCWASPVWALPLTTDDLVLVCLHCVQQFIEGKLLVAQTVQRRAIVSHRNTRKDQ